MYFHVAIRRGDLMYSPGLFYHIIPESSEEDWDQLVEFVAICDANNRLSFTTGSKATLGTLSKETPT